MCKDTPRLPSNRKLHRHPLRNPKTFVYRFVLSLLWLIPKRTFRLRQLCIDPLRSNSKALIFELQTVFAG